MFKDFSPAANVLEDKFQIKCQTLKNEKVGFVEKFFFGDNAKDISYELNQILLLRQDLYREIESYFRNVNDILKSDMSKKSKLRILVALINDTQDTIDIIPELSNAFVENEDQVYNFYLEIYSYAMSVVDTKYKRALESIGK
jgi:hypothetical protein